MQEEKEFVIIEKPNEFESEGNDDQNPYNDEFIQKLFNQKEERNSQINFKMKNLQIIQKSKQPSVSLLSDVSKGPVTHENQDDRIDVFNYSPRDDLEIPSDIINEFGFGQTNTDSQREYLF